MLKSVFINGAGANLCSDVTMTRQTVVRKESMHGSQDEQRRILYACPLNAARQIALLRMDSTVLQEACVAPGTQALLVPKGKMDKSEKCLRDAVRDGTVATLLLHAKPFLSRFYYPETGKLNDKCTAVRPDGRVRLWNLQGSCQ